MVRRELIGEFSKLSYRRRGKLKSCSRSLGKKSFWKVFVPGGW